MQSFQEYINEEKSGNYYKIGGDRYDGGIVVKVFVNGKEVDDQLLDGEQDYNYKGKKYGHVNKYLDAVAKDHGLSSHKDFKRMQMEGLVKEEESALVPKIVKHLKAAGVTPEVYDDDANFNVAFKVGKHEYFVRPNDNGASLFYVDSDISDDYDAPKVADLKELEKYAKGLKDKG